MYDRTSKQHRVAHKGRKHVLLIEALACLPPLVLLIWIMLMLRVFCRARLGGLKHRATPTF